MAGSTRLELATSGVTGRRSNQLNYDPARRPMLNGEFCVLNGIPAASVTLLPAAFNVRRSTFPLALPSRSARPVSGARRLVGGKGLEPLTAGV
jgi:hypothetical protein